tara:strand:- start:47 stop:502 length:456 start_codon:yes stop_codon:yes gene_type:complete
MSTIFADKFKNTSGGNNVKVNQLSGIDTAGSITVTGEGNSTTTNLQQGLCKQWIHFNGFGTIAIVGSFNTTSITDNGTGDYQVTIANDMANDDYSVSGTMCYDSTGTSSAARQGPAVNEHAVGSYQVYTGSNTTSQDDAAVINMQTMGDLA